MVSQSQCGISLIVALVLPVQRGEGADGGGYVSLGVVDGDAAYEPPVESRGSGSEQPVQTTHAETGKDPHPLP